MGLTRHELQRDAQTVDALQRIAKELGGIREELRRIADALSATTPDREVEEAS